MLIAHGVSPDKLRLHALGIDTQRFQPRMDMFAGDGERPVRVLMVGRLVEKKGFHYGLEAFAQSQAAQRARLTVIGEGPLGAALRTEASQLGIADRVEFLGGLPHAEVIARMRDHDILLAPCVIAENGDRDSGLIVLREAASCGLVPIATRMGGLPDSVDDNESGFLTEMRDVPAMSARLEQLLTDPHLRASMGRASREKMVREFDHSVSMPFLERAYDDARSMHAR